eukprot:COSAG06_NODE_1121_length_10629_cov_348.665337_7_plen_77_part_00
MCAIDAQRLVLSQALHAQAGRAESERVRASGREQSEAESEQGEGKHATSQVVPRHYGRKDAQQSGQPRGAGRGEIC